jgi:hypothetical protein
MSSAKEEGQLFSHLPDFASKNTSPKFKCNSEQTQILDHWPKNIVKPSILILSGGLTPKFIWNFVKLIVKKPFLNFEKN